MGAVVKTIGRRLFARATVGVPLALNLKHTGAAPPPMGGGYPVSGLSGMPADPVKMAFTEKVWKAVRIGTRPDQEHESLRYTRRAMMGGLDPDLAVLNSMSLARRVQVQIEREVSAREKDRSLRHRIIKGLGGNPEEFE